MNTERINAITETILDNIHVDTLMEILYNVVKYVARIIIAKQTGLQGKFSRILYQRTC